MTHPTIARATIAAAVLVSTACGNAADDADPDADAPTTSETTTAGGEDSGARAPETAAETAHPGQVDAGLTDAMGAGSTSDSSVASDALEDEPELAVTGFLTSAELAPMAESAALTGQQAIDSLRSIPFLGRPTILMNEPSPQASPAQIAADEKERADHMTVTISQNNYRLELDYAPPADSTSKDGVTVSTSSLRKRLLIAGYCGGVDLRDLAKRPPDAALLADLATRCNQGTKWRSFQHALSQFSFHFQYAVNGVSTAFSRDYLSTRASTTIAGAPCEQERVSGRWIVKPCQFTRRDFTSRVYAATPGTTENYGEGSVFTQLAMEGAIRLPGEPFYAAGHIGVRTGAWTGRIDAADGTRRPIYAITLGGTNLSGPLPTP